MNIDFSNDSESAAAHSRVAIRVPRTKVCGVTREQDLDCLAAHGIDAVGFNFVSKSPRCVSVARAKVLAARAAELGLLRVGVVMDRSTDAMAELLQQVDLDVLQLHGEESPDVASSLPPIALIKAIAWSGRAEELALARQWSEYHCATLGQTDAQDSSTSSSSGSGPTSTTPPGSHSRGGPCPLLAFLVDAYAPGQGGGTGRVARWDLLKPRPEALLASVPLLLAGGIVPSNVVAAVLATGADGVDTASGVELEPGVKSAEAIAAFARAAARAFNLPSN